MDPGLPRDALTLTAGLVTGVLSGSFGIGGAVFATPAIRALGVPALVAIGTTLPSILPGAASGSARYATERLIDWRAVVIAAPAGAVASVAGSVLSHRVPGEGHFLMILTALLLAASAVRTVRAPPPPGPDALPGRHGDADDAGRPGGARRRWELTGVGVLAGLLSGLLGVGGGTILVPGLTLVAGMAIKPAIATSLACVGILAVPGTVTHALLGGIDWRVALLLAVGVVPGARLGAVLAIRAGDRRLRVAVAIFLGGLSIVYLVGETLALLNR